MRSRRARVALVDRHALLTGCLAAAFERFDFETRIVCLPAPPLAGTVERAAREVRAFAPHAVILGSDLGPHGESETLLVSLASSGLPVVVLAQEDDASQSGAYVARGARAVVPMSAPLSSVCAVVRRLAAGMPVLSRTEQEQLVAAYRDRCGARHHDREYLATLTPNEADILRLLMAGFSPAEMAHSRVVSVSTVRTQVKRILSKLEVHSQVAAVATAYRAGWSPTRPRLPRVG